VFIVFCPNSPKGKKAIASDIALKRFCHNRDVAYNSVYLACSRSRGSITNTATITKLLLAGHGGADL
jgi:hypothetical protein